MAFDKIICPSCHKEVYSMLRYCPYCGAKLQDKEEQKTMGTSIVLPKSVAGIRAEDYMHPLDKSTLQALKSIPGFPELIKAVMSVWGETQNHIVNMAGNLRLSEKQMPDIYRLLPPICQKLKIPVPELYITQNETPNAWTSGDKKPFITITTGMLNRFPEKLWSTVIAHECGHIACHHVLYHSIGTLLLNGGGTILSSKLPALGKIISIPLEYAFFHWMRCSELSADRAAIICSGSSDDVVEMCMRFSGYYRDVITEEGKQAFMEQVRDYKMEKDNSLLQKAMEIYILQQQTHPMNAIRAKEADAWTHTAAFQQICQ